MTGLTVAGLGPSPAGRVESKRSSRENRMARTGIRNKLRVPRVELRLRSGPSPEASGVCRSSKTGAALWVAARANTY